MIARLEAIGKTLEHCEGIAKGAALRQELAEARALVAELRAELIEAGADCCLLCGPGPHLAGCPQYQAAVAP